MSIQNDPNLPISYIFIFDTETVITHLRNVLSKHYFIPKCRQFYSASFEKIKKGGTHAFFWAIIKKLKQNRDFNTIFLYKKTVYDVNPRK